MTSSTFDHSTTNVIKYLDEPTISPITIENIASWADNTRNTKLSDSEIEQIKKTLKEDDYLEVMGELLNHFISLKGNFGGMAGLTNEEVDKLKSLIAKRKEFKDARAKNRIRLSGYERFIENERQITPMEKTIQWWMGNSESLRKQHVWDDLRELTLTMSKKAHETEANAKIQVGKLENIKNQWARHQLFARYSSQNLLGFYKDYICILEKRLVAKLNGKNNYPVVIRDYLNHVLVQIREVKRQAIYSMLQRLICIEYYKDVCCDDVLIYTFDRIDEECKINIQGNGLKPAPRRGITPALIANFCDEIQQYCNAAPQETRLHSEFNALRMRNANTMPPSNNKHPLITYFINSFAEIYESSRKKPDLHKVILNSNILVNQRFSLNILKSLIDNTNIIYNDLGTEDIHIKKFIDDAKKNYRNHLTDISLNMDVAIQKQLEAMIDDALSLKNIDDDKLHTLLAQIKNAREYHENFLDAEYFPQGDIILALANKIRIMMAEHQPITREHCDKMLKLMLSTHFFIRSEQIGQYRDLFRQLPDIILKIKDANENQILHFLVHQLEMPILNGNQINTSLLRHKHIARTLNEQWDEGRPNNDASETKENLVYLRNVCLNVLKTSPVITLDNFDTNMDCHMMEKVEQLISEEEQETNNKTAIAHRDELNLIKRKFEDKLLIKINDAFTFKTYLYLENERKIDTTKLQNLIKRSNKFFTNETNRRTILNSLQKSCTALLKNYCLGAIENEENIDITYINQLNNCLGQNLFQQLCVDNDVRKILKSYIDTYDGTKTKLSGLLTQLTPNDSFCECEKYICAYANKRIEYIAISKDITSEDYDFFAHYEKIPQIASMMKEHRKLFKDIPQSTLKDKSTLWDKSTALIVELFGDDQTVYLYREKRIMELFRLDSDKSIRSYDKKNLFSDFMTTVNKNRLIGSKLIAPDANPVMHSFIDEAVNNREWSLLLEELVTHTGTQQQLQQLHFNYISNSINKISPILEDWFNQKMTAHARKLSESNDADAVLNQDLNKLFYLNFLGETNTKIICDKLDQLLAELMQANLKLNTNELDKNEYHNLHRIIVAVKPLESLYHSFGTNPQHKELFLRMSDLEKKIQLHYDLNGIIKQHTMLMDIANDNPSLHNLILSLIKAVKEIEDSRILTDKNVDHYIAFCDVEILANIQKILARQHSHMSYEVAATLSNLIHHLTSEQLKMLLVSAHKEEVTENPLWLTLINHIGDKTFLNNLVANIATLNNDPEHPPQHSHEFNQALTFANRIVDLKDQTNLMLKTTLLEEAGIKPNAFKSRNINEFINSKDIKNDQLISLWSACAGKLKVDQLTTNTNLSYAFYLIRFLTKISNSIIARTHNNPALIHQFSAALGQIPDIRRTIRAIFDQRKASSTTGRHSMLWATIPESARLLEPISIITDKSCALQLMQIVEKYVQHKLSGNKLTIFKQYCNDPQFSKSGRKTELKELEVKLTFDIKDSNQAKKILNTMKIYKTLTSIESQQIQIDQISDLINELLNDANTHKNLGTSKGYMRFLHEIETMLAQYIASKSDNEFASKPNKKYNLHIVGGPTSRRHLK